MQHYLQKHSSPVTVDIANNLYVDNVVTGCATDTEAIEYYTEARAILSEAKFNLRAWADVVKKCAAHDGANDIDGTTKVLGLLWHTPSDTIS